MCKKQLNRLTLDNIIAKKLERDKNEIKFKDIEVPSLEGTILFNKPSDEDVFQTLETLNNNQENLHEIDAAFTQLIYNCCPTFKELYKSKKVEGITIPTEIVKEFLIFSDRIKIGNELIEMSGLNQDELGQSIKK